MTDLERAQHLFQEAGLAFPAIPEQLAATLKEQGKWLFSTRELKMSPYNLQYYVHDGDGAPSGDYAVLCHSGHGVNSYAVQYYLVLGALRMFLHLEWGGAYMDAKETTSNIRECFSRADEVVSVVNTNQGLRLTDPLLIVCSDFYGSYWSAPGESRREADRPLEALAEALQWLKS
ncbi:MAG: hypothetical protein ABSA41_12290 [Terriglobia bacterium]|jgi:hypothetical protein